MSVAVACTVYVPDFRVCVRRRWWMPAIAPRGCDCPSPQFTLTSRMFAVALTAKVNDAGCPAAIDVVGAVMVMPVRGFSDDGHCRRFPRHVRGHCRFCASRSASRSPRRWNLCWRLGPTACPHPPEADGYTRDGLPGAAFDARRNHRRPAGCAERLRRCRQHDVIDRRAADQQILDLARRSARVRRDRRRCRSGHRR